MKIRICNLITALALLISASATFAAPASKHKTKNIVFVMTDGLRWQEVFRGAEASLMTKENKVEDADALQQSYAGDTSEARRQALMPFLWSMVAKNGQIYGNRDKGSDALVTNTRYFSYPGYNETLCGFADDRIDSNNKIPNQNVTVLEWLNRKPSYHGRIAAFTAWDVFPFILNTGRSGLLVDSAYAPLSEIPGNPRIDLLNQLKGELPQVWDNEAFDALQFRTALEYLKEHKPRVLYISMGETDTWAHRGDYPEYLKAAHRVDNYLKILWETLQSMPEYRDRTTLIFSPDHGRGEGEKWRDHGREAPDSKYIWMAFLGPDTPALGERSNIPAVTQNQIAATLAALFGEDYGAEVPKAGQPVGDVLPR